NDPKKVIIKNNSAIDVHPKVMIRKKSFIMFFLWTTFVASASLLIIGHAVPFAEDIGANLKIAALAAGVISAFNGLSRMPFGKLYDLIGNTRMIKVVTLIMGIGTFLILI